MMFRRSGVTRTRDLGRVGIGLGLALIALHHLLAMITPMRTRQTCACCWARSQQTR
jgi:Na+/phosphate symporter